MTDAEGTTQDASAAHAPAALAPRICTRGKAPAANPRRITFRRLNEFDDLVIRVTPWLVSRFIAPVAICRLASRAQR